MATRRIICLCGAPLSRDEREHYAYQCTLCVTREHELILAHGRGEDHDEIEFLFTGLVDLDLAHRRPSRRQRKAA